MKRPLARTLDWIDSRLAAVATRRRRERPGLLSIFFHSVFESQQEIDSETMWPAQPLRTEDLALVIEYFQSQGYSFVRPAEILAGLDPAGHHLWLTFDDGYANNQRALPVLRQFGVPATFFVCARHVAENRAFWWDVVYRRRRRQGMSTGSIRVELEALKRKPADSVEHWLTQTFGADCLRPVGDSDRPFSTAELRGFASEPLVSIGNHSASHIDLTRCGADRAATEIRDCQTFLADAIGMAPVALAYPYGRCNASTVAVAAAEGLRLGAATRRTKARLPLAGDEILQVPRTFLRCGGDLLADCERSRADVQLRPWLETALGRN